MPPPPPPPPSSSSSSLSMERKKSRSRGSVDDLALAKAAAWAWYERGSASEGKPIREHDVTRTPRAPRPSRYRQEAVKLAQLAKVQDDKEREKEKEKENSLMDPYEVHVISRQIDRFTESGRFYDNNYAGSAKVGLHHDHWKCDTTSPESERSGGRKKRKEKKSSGFWQRHGVMCPTREDVVEASVLREARSRRNKHVPVVR
ncbi:uncharacterized protein LOC115733797 [Rhodamnia argentea]|uniref:Uncharacterized protein LOC115733797 n=1 Tax=Rhodamnia argentea TaxID=178133 RepID=A0A8B8NE61_9MYRT|nr:uncharacterized protein LOC115733797 [Rhodamnia argentea]